MKSSFEGHVIAEPLGEEYIELYLYEFLEGTDDFIGMIPLINDFMDSKAYRFEMKARVNHYMDFLLQRSRGEIKTGARYIRDFVLQHKAYKKDSIVSSEIMYDLL